jgi:uncharacterized protein YceK
VFDELGVDHLFIDEPHYFKNLETPTKMDRVAGIQTGGSERAFDLYMKARFLDQRHAGRGMTFATGTPISNAQAGWLAPAGQLSPWPAPLAAREDALNAVLESSASPALRRETLRADALADDPRPDTTTILPVAEYDLIVDCFPDGKDSLAGLLHVLDRCDAATVPRSIDEAWHPLVDGPDPDGLSDWPAAISRQRRPRGPADATGIAFARGVRYMRHTEHRVTARGLSMTARIGLLASALSLAVLPLGCGTVLNLTASPTPGPTPTMIGPSSCEPFAGVERSAKGGMFVLACPPYIPIGVWILAVDTPLSLVGDVLTLPVVYARKRGEPWATWWGAQARAVPEPGPETGRTTAAGVTPDAPPPPATPDPCPGSGR